MKRYLIIIAAFFALATLHSCEEGMDLEVVNENEPTLDVLNTEEGIKNAGLGVYELGMYWEYFWDIRAKHAIMGDALFIPWGNQGWRWLNQPTWIELDDGTVIYPPEGGTQAEEIEMRNTRSLAEDNPIMMEWQTMYAVNNQANLILAKLDEDINFNGDAEVKKSTLRAWALFWKGHAYSRLGSIYENGLINDTYNETNDNYVAHDKLIEEANSNFNEAITILQSLESNADYNSIMSAVIPSFCQDADGPITPAEWIRYMNSYMARNLMANKKVDEMTADDWNAVLSLANQGIQQGDEVFIMKDDPTLMGHWWMHSYIYWGWMFPSERLIQDAKAGDQRIANSFVQDEATINMRGRGIQYGTSWYPLNDSRYVSDGYDIVTSYIAVSWAENELMLAEAKIRANNIDDGLTHVDNVRTDQAAGLADVANTGLSQAEALEELRIERRIGLFLRGTAFYDARRLGITAPVSEGGGRTGCIVWAADGTKNTNAIFNYNYMDYWPVPTTETDFNPQKPSSKK